MMKQGILYIISAPSGAGKSTLIKELIKKKFFNIKLSISYTTRTIREGEKHGKDYFFISIDEFKKMIIKEEFLEYAKVLGNYYGTWSISIKKFLKKGISILLDIDWQGAQQIRMKKLNVCSIFILPPSKKELIYRLKNRGKDNKEAIIFRIKQGKIDMMHYEEYNYIIINENFNTALNQLRSILLAEQLSTHYQKLRYSKLIDRLLK